MADQKTYPVLVVIESPWRGETPDEKARNIAYLNACLRDSCVNRGEAPFASHHMYTDILDDDKPMERQVGIECGLAWGRWATKTVVYEDLGRTAGMETGIQAAIQNGRHVEFRRIAGWAWPRKT